MGDGVEPSAEELRAKYADLSEVELMVVARKYDELQPEAQAALRVEFAKRELEPPIVPDDGMKPEYRKLVTVERFRDLAPAMVARSALEADGIPCFAYDENFVRLDWGYSNFIGGIRLQVDAENVERAKEILTAPVPESFDVDGTQFTQPKCPNCGSLKVAGDNFNQKVALASTVGFGLLLPVGLPILAFSKGNDVWKCEDCGCLWTDDEDEPASSAVTPVN